MALTINSMLKITPDTIGYGEAVVGYMKDGKQITFPYETDVCSDLYGFFSSRDLGLEPIVARTRAELNASGASEAWFGDGYTNPLDRTLPNPEYVEVNLTLEKARIVEGATSIGQSAFDSCLHLREVIIPDTVTRIGKDAFSCCENLQAINLPEGLKKIEEGLLSGCLSLRQIIIPEGVESIGPWFISDSNNLKYISIPSTAWEIDFRAFVSAGKGPQYVTLRINRPVTDMRQVPAVPHTWTVYKNFVGTAV